MKKNHFTATGIVFNKKGQILMIYHKKLNVWLPPGGHIEENELPDDAVIREIFEETGIKAQIISTEKKLSLTKMHCKELEHPFLILLEDIEGDGNHNHIDMIYLCTATNEALIPQKSEVTDIGWFFHDQIEELNTYENVKQAIRKSTDYILKDKNKKDK